MRFDGELRAACRADGFAQPDGRGEVGVAGSGSEHDRQMIAEREVAG
jgi:hypothetical protein